MKIRTSKKNSELIDKLTLIYNFKSEGIIPRIAFAFSIQLGKRFDLDSVDDLITGGKDWTDERFFLGSAIGNQADTIIFKVLLDQHYEKVLSDEEFERFFKLHLDFGLEKIHNDLKNKNLIDGYHITYLMKIVKDGLAVLSKKPKINIQPSQYLQLKECKLLIEFELGKDENNIPVRIRLNDLNEYDSNHIAIAGMTGSGKTQLIKDIIYQIIKNSKGQLKFIFFDYKGEQKENLTDFLDSTDCKFVDVLKDNYEFNPMEIINSTDEDIRDNQILTFSDTLCGIAQLGPKQGLILRKVIRSFFEEHPKQVPSIDDIYVCLEIYYKESKLKPDTLIDIFDKLSRGIFSCENNNSEKIYNQNIYLNLPSSIPETVRQLTVFFTLKYLLNIFSSSNDTEPDDNKIKPLRYIIVVDEAHVYLKNKNARAALQEMLRVVRSKGVVVVMLSQGAEDYRQKDFDFSSQVKIPICLNVKNKDYRIIEPFVGTPNNKSKLELIINKLRNGYGIINTKETKVFEIRQFWKTMNEKSN